MQTTSHSGGFRKYPLVVRFFFLHQLNCRAAFDIYTAACSLQQGFVKFQLTDAPLASPFVQRCRSENSMFSSSEDTLQQLQSIFISFAVLDIVDHFDKSFLKTALHVSYTYFI